LAVKKPWPDPKYFFAAPVREQAKRIAWEHLKSLVPKSWLAGNPLEGDLIIKTRFGSWLYVIGLDRPYRAEGVQWDGGVVDECSDIRPGAVEKSFLPAMTHRDPWLWQIGVPKRSGIGARAYRQACEEALTRGAGFTWPSRDIVQPGVLARLAKLLDPKDFREQFEASFENASGGVFYCFNREYNVRPVTYYDTKPIVVGSDFNVDPMCWILAHRYQEKFEVFDEIVLRNTNTAAALETLWQRYQHHKGGFEFYGDATAGARKTSAATSDYQQIMAHPKFVKAGRSVHYPKANPKKVDRFAACNAMLCNAAGDRRLFVDPRCKFLIDDLEQRAYAEGTRETDDEGDVGHITDALGYPVYRLYPIKVDTNELQTISISG